MASGPPSQGINAHTVLSPTLSQASFSSFSELTVRSSDDPFETFDESSSDEDEVVWTGNEFDSEDDFILVPQAHPAHAVPEVDAPASAFSQLSLAEPPTPTTPTPGPTLVQTPSKFTSGRSTACILTPASTAPRAPRSRRRRAKRDATESYPSPSPSPERDLAPTPIFEEEVGFGERLVVEESDGDEPVLKCYEDAVRYITSFLASPTGALSCSSCTRLTFLQSLIIELGLLAPTSALPPSLSAAKRFLKARAFINISAYLSVRGQGLDQLRSAMYNSRRELASDLRRRRGVRKADKGWVKRHGLNVLLVSVY